MANYKGLSIPTYKMPSDSKKTPFLRDITLNYGSDGFCIIVNMDRLILSGRYGYYINNTKDCLFDLREITGISTQKIKEIIKYAVEEGYYSKKAIIKYDIITNLNLAKNFVKECKNRKGFKTELNRICGIFDLKEEELLPKKREHYNIDNLKPFKKGTQTQESINKQENEIEAMQQHDENILQTSHLVNNKKFNENKSLLKRVVKIKK